MMDDSDPVLPPLIIDGEPKVLHTMTVRELQVFLMLVLKAIYKPTFYHYTPLSLSAIERPRWWPAEIPFTNGFLQSLPVGKDRLSYLRHLITTCYMHYGQENRLYLFDVHEGEPLRWRLRDDGIGWNLLDTGSNKIVWNFAKSYQILPLLSLKAQYEGTAELMDSQADASSSSGATAEHQPISRHGSMRTRGSSALDSTAVGLPRVADLAGMNGLASLAGKSPRSIMNLVQSRLASTSSSSIELPPITHSIYRCPDCAFYTPVMKNYLNHIQKLHRPVASSRSKETLESFAFEHLNLVSKSTLKKIPQPELVEGEPSLRQSLQLAKIPFSSISGQKIHEMLPGRYEGQIPDYERFCGTEFSEKQVSKLYPVCYRPTRLIMHFHTLKLNRADYEANKPLLRKPKYLLPKKVRFQTLQTLVKPCQIEVERMNVERIQEQLQERRRERISGIGTEERARRKRKRKFGGRPKKNRNHTGEVRVEAKSVVPKFLADGNLEQESADGWSFSENDGETQGLVSNGKMVRAKSENSKKKLRVKKSRTLQLQQNSKIRGISKNRTNPAQKSPRPRRQIKPNRKYVEMPRSPTRKTVSGRWNSSNYISAIKKSATKSSRSKVSTVVVNPVKLLERRKRSSEVTGSKVTVSPPKTPKLAQPDRRSHSPEYGSPELFTSGVTVKKSIKSGDHQNTSIPPSTPTDFPSRIRTRSGSSFTNKSVEFTVPLSVKVGKSTRGVPPTPAETPPPPDPSGSEVKGHEKLRTSPRQKTSSAIFKCHLCSGFEKLLQSSNVWQLILEHVRGSHPGVSVRYKRNDRGHSTYYRVPVVEAFRD